MVDETKPKRGTGVTAAIRGIKPGESKIILAKQHRADMLARKITKRTGRRFAIRTISATAVRVWRLS